MITGFNTDVRHGAVVFHVQTEDKGTGNPCIESLVYVGGQIVARKRAGYRSLLDGGEASKAIAELMESQHRSMIQEIRAGTMDEKVAAIKGAAPAEAAPTPAPTRVAPPPPRAPAAPPAEPAEPSRPPPASPRPAAKPASAAVAGPEASAPTPPQARPPKPEPKPPQAPPSRPKHVPPAVVRPGPPARPHPPPPAVKRPEPAKEAGDRTLDQVILDYLEMESDQERLVLTMNRREGELEAGRETTLLFRTESSVDRDPIGQALITVRLISTVDEPQVLAEGRTDDRGELALTVSIPELKAGTGALIINAESSIGTAESRHLI